MYVKLGMMNAVVFSSHETVKETLNHDKANDRDQAGFVGDRNLHKNIGIIWGNREIWQNLRRFTIRTLRDFGFGKTASMDVVINEELTKLLGHFEKTLNRSQNNNMVISKELFDLSVLNVLWRLVTGKSYELTDARLKQLLLLSNEFIKAATNDVFLAKIDQNPNSLTFNDQQLIYTLLDLFQAGADTSSNTLTFALLYLTLHPEKQEKVHEELDAGVSKDGVITAELKSKLPYCTATLLETLRYSSLVPFPANREAIEDFKLKNYVIKKGTAIMVNLQALHFDEDVWGDPQVFRPERFLTNDGVVDKRMADLVMAFGGGRRVCLGQSLTEATMLMYFTAVFRNFKFERVVGKLAPSTVPIFGLVYLPRPFEARVIRRE